MLQIRKWPLILKNRPKVNFWESQGQISGIPQLPTQILTIRFPRSNPLLKIGASKKMLTQQNPIVVG